MEYQIWMEGYAATGERSDAQYIGKSQGETFEEAVLNYRDQEGNPIKIDRNQDGTPRIFGGHLCIWACRLFDNEEDARKSFG